MRTRRNILASTSARDAWLEGLVALDGMDSGVRTSEAYEIVRGILPAFRMSGIDQPLSVYDMFVLWHVAAMELDTGGGRSTAHGGPIFLPWHRHFLILLEEWMGIALKDDDFALPYWDWAADGNLDPSQQWQTVLWTSDYLGEARGEVSSGAVGRTRVRLSGAGGTLKSIAPRPLRRNAGADPNPNWRRLPGKGDVQTVMQEPLYDVEPYSMHSLGGLRNRLEGWLGIWAPQLHNMVHVWIGGDMAPATSPNDPVFLLNHANVDRIWEAWMVRHGRVFAPGPTEGPRGQRLDSAMFSLLGESRTVDEVLNATDRYVYDDLAVD